MRFYSFVNMYLSRLQIGLQSAHCLADMFVKYAPVITEDGKSITSTQLLQLNNWAQNHKTMILLNGGFSQAIHELYTFFEDKENPFPYARFYEGDDALDGALTCCGIVLPDRIYKGAAELRKGGEVDFDLNRSGCIFFIDPETNNIIEEKYSKWEAKLMYKLNNFRLAS